MADPKELVDRLEQGAELPRGDEERFVGYAVLGVPFASGHLLAMRRWPVSSLGGGYTSVWHRDPQGKWIFYTDVPPQLGCPRYFGSAVAEAEVRDIEIAWTGSRDFTVSIEDDPGLDWRLSLARTPVMRLMNVMGTIMPDALWRREAVLKLMGKAASLVLRAGRLELAGQVPNRQRFIANPLLLWEVHSSTARMGEQDLGEVSPLPVQTRLGDFWLPQRGIFTIGRGFFEPLDPARHALTTATTPSG